MINYQNERIDFIVLAKNFGIYSKIVDPSFITIDNIKHTLIKFFKNFTFRNQVDIYFHELIKFDGYRISSQAKYSKITKI